jgi:hypothetical protein
MLPAAKEAQIDFVRLASEEPSSLYFEEFLRSGFSAWPTFYQDRFPGLSTWTGVRGLKRSIRQLTNAASDCQVLLASRSLSLVQIASSCMFRTCRNVLTTDLSWPTYQQVLKRKARSTGNYVTTIPLRDEILYQGWTVDDVSTYIANAFNQHQCDGLFLPAVDHLGVRLPLRHIVDQIEKVSELRFCFIDAAQAFCHVPLDDCLECADFIVAGSHKWMGAYMPTGIGMFGLRRTREIVEHRLRHILQKGYCGDPLLQFTEQLAGGTVDGYTQTANLANLFACAGAAAERLTNQPCGAYIETTIDSILESKPRLRNTWTPLLPQPEFQTRISLLKDGSPNRDLSGGEVRQQWLDAGCIVSGYCRGLARLSVDRC